MDKRRKGFTLVELLIVIIIIAILAAMLLLSSGAAISIAEATKIVSDIRMLQGAALSYYLDNGSLPSISPNGSPTPLSATEIEGISKHLDRDVDANRYGEVYIVRGPAVNDGRILLGLNYKRNVEGVSTNLPNINARLAGMASDVGLCGLDGNVFQPSANTEIVYIWLK